MYLYTGPYAQYLPLLSLVFSIVLQVTYNYPDPTPVAYRNHSVTPELNQHSEMAARGTHAHSITTSIDFYLQPSQEASPESSQIPNTPQTAKSTETESEREEQRKRKK